MTVSRKSTPRLPEHLPPLTDEEGEVRELTAEDMKHFRPTKEVFPEVAEAFERMRGQRGPQKTPTKERIGLRLDHEVVEHFRKTGRGWQSRINEVLVKHVRGRGG